MSVNCELKDAMDLKWEDLVYGGTVGFSRDLYDKYSLAPTVKELCGMAQSCSPDKVEVKPDPAVENVSNKPDCEPSLDLEKTSPHGKTNPPFPEPRVPYPCLSSMTAKEQLLYVRYLYHNLSQCSVPDVNLSLLQEKVNKETTEFMKYLQNVAKICADDYNYMSQGAAQYSEECLSASLKIVKNYPRVYLIHEMTSVTGGKFSPGLTLNFEKQLLALGNVMNVALPRNKLPKNIQLPEDCESVSSDTPPVKKASLTHAAISDDLNAAKLYARYEPHVCMTKQAFVRLLNNHGPEYSEQWEIPVWVKMTAGKDPRKEVYIDSPLVKTEMTVRERNHLFHEESMKLAIRRSVQKNVLDLQLEISTLECTDSQRSQISYDSDVDLTDLETFGESATKTLKEPTPSGVKPALAVVKSPPQERPPPRNRLKHELSAECSSDHSSADSDEERLVIDAPPVPSSSSMETNRPKPPSTSLTKELAPPSDSVLHTTSSRSSDGVPDSLNFASPAPILDSPRSPSPGPRRRAQSSTASPVKEKARRVSRSAAPRASQECDQLGQILRMQSALLKPSPNPAHIPPSSPSRGAPQGSATSPAQSHSLSLVKTCVSSYMEANQGLVQGASVSLASAATGPVNNQATAKCKRLLSEELLLSVEDEQKYECPEEGNLLYRLYSMQDMLLMVRSSVPQAIKRTIAVVPELVPAHILPKLEYQLCYGIESLTKSEVCQLWAERLLHPSTISFIAQIDALTSKLLKIKELLPGEMEKASCAFVPAKSLNILQHVLKKVSGLQEGRYLLCHKAGESLITIMKACEGTIMTRTTYDLHQAHSRLPQAPPNAPVPWVPVDPTYRLPFHIDHNRIPCTFPPNPALQVPHANWGRAPGRRKGKRGAGRPNKCKGEGATSPKKRKRNTRD